MRRAYLATDVKTAMRLLTNLAKRLDDHYLSAAGSVREGLDETLTVLTLHIDVVSVPVRDVLDPQLAMCSCL